ncbi:MAG: hypothetical protein ACK5MI_03980 [Mangrovibacterium sp.]
MVVLLLGVTVTAEANAPVKKDFKRSGRVFGSIFTGLEFLPENEETNKEFVLDRLEIGYIYHFSENWLVKGCFDVTNPKDNGELKHSAFSRNAFAEYHNDKLILRFGMITGISFNFVEKCWGHRYIAKSYQEYFDYSASRDIGITGSYQATRTIKLDWIVSNGEGYKSQQNDNAFEYGIGATITPFKGWVFRTYADYSNSKDVVEDTYAFMAGYQFKNGNSVGAEYNRQRNAKVTAGQCQHGCSFYTTIRLTPKMHIYGRYDYNDRAKTWDDGDNVHAVFAGLEFRPVKGIKIAPNYVLNTHTVGDVSTVNEYRISCEFKF